MGAIRKIYRCFPGGKHKVLTMSYDDGKEEDRRLVSLFNEYGIRGTFNLNSGLSGEADKIHPEEFASLYKGHEVACHTFNHPTGERCPISHYSRQILEDRIGLESAMRYPVTGLAYPNGSYSPAIKEALPSLGIKYARVVANTENYTMPQDPYEWRPTCHHNHRLGELADGFLSLNKTQYLYLLFVWGHSYEFSMQNNWELIEGFCRKTAFREDVWYATNGEIIENGEVFARLAFAADGSFVQNPSGASAWLSVDGKIVEVPAGATVEL